MSDDSPAHNRIGIDYRLPPARKWVASPEEPTGGGIIDCHMHAAGVEATRVFLAAADTYGIGKIWTMTQLENVPALQAAFPGRFEFIAVPKWQDGGPGDPFISDWLRRLEAFYKHGARLVKFHQAPGTRVRWQMSLDHPQMRRIIKHAYELGYHFMSHIGDPKVWFEPGKPYADHAKFGTFTEQFLLLDEMLAEFPDRIHLGAHMGGSLEDLAALSQRLDRFPHYVVDSSATKWIVRAIVDAADRAPHGVGLNQVREFFIKYQDRILFGSDLVVNERFDFDHYASRYWVHEQMWETRYRGESPIEDPDGTHPPRLLGLDLPVEVLQKIYRDNTLRWLPRG